MYDEFRQFLPEDHPFRDELKHLFNNVCERDPPPPRHTLADWYNKWITLQAFGAGTSRTNINCPPGMTRLSAFHELPYWRSLPLQHCLDPMHIFKNICKSLISHLVGEKDNIAARRDLELSNTKPFVYSSDVEQVFFAVDEAEPQQSFVLQSQIKKHTIFSYRGILSLNAGSHVPGLMAGPEQVPIPSNHDDNELQMYSSEESSSASDSDDEADYANDVQNVNSTSDEDSQIGSRQLRYKFVFTFISYILTIVVVILKYPNCYQF